MDVVWDALAGLSVVHFASAKLGDLRRSRRLVRSAELIMKSPAGTLPDKLPRWADLMGLYRLLESEAVTHSAVLAAHAGRTREAMGRHPVVLLVHDDTELDYSHIEQLGDQLGQIGNGRNRGYICHNSLALTPDKQVIGLAHQILHTRRQVSGRETPAAKRAHPQRESRLWVTACEAIGPAPQNSLWIDIADRGSDTFEFLDHEHAQQRSYVIRSCRDRKLQGADHVGSDRIYQTLHEYARDLPTLGTRQIELPSQSKTGGARRRAKLSISAGPVTLAVPHFVRGESRQRPLDLWVVRVAETEAPANVEPVEWILLSNLPADSFTAAAKLVDYYACRPMIEDYHKGLKTGVGIELTQLEDAEKLQPLIALLSVVAALLLQLRHAARSEQADQIPAHAIVPKLWVQVLAGHLSKQQPRWQERSGLRPPQSMSLKQFCIGVARLGGYLNRKNDGPPGWLTLWRGWSDLQRMIEGAEALIRMKSV
jgi:hypothetical protein